VSHVDIRLAEQFSIASHVDIRLYFRVPQPPAVLAVKRSQSDEACGVLDIIDNTFRNVCEVITCSLLLKAELVCAEDSVFDLY
jgi:hypothetical protein